MKTLVVTLVLAASPVAALSGEVSGAAGLLRSSSPLASAIATSADPAPDVRTKTAPVSQQMKITIGRRVFRATLQDNATTAAFKTLLPLRLEMHDVNRNEKAFDFPSRLPTADMNPSAIRAGDLMIWSSRTLVVFYKSFSTPYSYTRLGRIDDPMGLAEALGEGNVTVTLELE